MTTIFITLIILIALIAILLVIFIRPNSKPKTSEYILYSGRIMLILFLEYSNIDPVLRWNQTAIVVAGVTGQSGNASNKLCYPYGLAIDWSNALYIADRCNNRVQKYTKGALYGETVAGQESGANGIGLSFLSGVTDVAVDSSGNIYAADTDNSRIQMWSPGSSTGITVAGVTGKLYNFHKIYLFSHI